MEPLLRIQDLSIRFSFDAVAAVENISFELFGGQITAVVGESGSGKSVTALSILKLLPKQAIVTGNIFYEQGKGEQELTRMSDTDIRTIRGNKIAMIFQ